MTSRVDELITFRDQSHNDKNTNSVIMAFIKSERSSVMKRAFEKRPPISKEITIQLLEMRSHRLRWRQKLRSLNRMRVVQSNSRPSGTARGVFFFTELGQTEPWRQPANLNEPVQPWTFAKLGKKKQTRYSSSMTSLQWNQPKRIIPPEWGKTSISPSPTPIQGKRTR